MGALVQLARKIRIKVKELLMNRFMARASKRLFLCVWYEVLRMSED